MFYIKSRFYPFVGVDLKIWPPGPVLALWQQSFRWAGFSWVASVPGSNISHLVQLTHLHFSLSLVGIRACDFCRRHCFSHMRDGQFKSHYQGQFSIPVSRKVKSFFIIMLKMIKAVNIHFSGLLALVYYPSF